MIRISDRGWQVQRESAHEFQISSLAEISRFVLPTPVVPTDPARCAPLITCRGPLHESSQGAQVWTCTSILRNRSGRLTMTAVSDSYRIPAIAKEHRQPTYAKSSVVKHDKIAGSVNMHDGIFLEGWQLPRQHRHGSETEAMAAMRPVSSQASL